MKLVSAERVFPDILTLLKHQASDLGNKIALEFEGSESVSYRELHDHVVNTAGRLAGAGLTKPGQRPRIGIVMPNGLRMATTLLSVTVLGVAVPFNPNYTLVEFESYFRETRIDALIVPKGDRNYAILAATALGIPVIQVDENGEVLAPFIQASPLPLPQPGDVALVLLTSGSTGRAKSVPLTHRNVCTSARDVCRSMALGPADRCLAMWEQYHVGGLVDLLLAPLASGGTVICTKGFNAAVFYRLLNSAKPTWFQVVPTTLNDIVGHARRQGLNPRGTSLRLLRSVAAALSPRLMAESEDLFHLPVIATFGMTEAGPLITSTPLPPAVRKPGSVGKSCGCEIRIADANGNTLPAGSEGQVAIRGDNVFSGYEGDAVANAAQFREGWFFTGDLGRLDAEGELTLTGRLKQLINRGGEKVNPQEVDDALVSHPAVAEAACFPVAHLTLGEDVAAAVVLRSPAGIDEIRRHLATLLAPFKIPARIQVLESLPRNAVGKVDRLALAEAMANRDIQAVNASVKVSSLEERIAKVWARELNLPYVNAVADFRAIGGDSLSAVRIFLAVETELGYALPESSLTQIYTVRDMVRIIESGHSTGTVSSSGSISSALTAVESRALQSVLILGKLKPAYVGSTIGAHNIDGMLPPIYWGYNNANKDTAVMAEMWGEDQPIYPFYSGGKLFPNDNDTLDRMAKHYAAEIQRVQPQGPYRIGGNCKGGWVAARIAKLLIAEGKEVSHLILYEYGDAALASLPIRQLFIFGKQSKRHEYRAIGLTPKGLTVPFAVRPVVAWIGGRHGDFYRPDNLKEFIHIAKCYLSGSPLPYSASQSCTAYVLFFQHNRVLFLLYVKWFNAWSRLRRVFSR
jgi:acyl-CoA synthetase (AMP-forming)/AMP-acid ligase II/acyl carrier protein